MLSLISPSGRLQPWPFAIAVVVVYLISFVSQALLSSPATAQVGIWPFAVLQVLLTWVWFVLHVQRLRDARQSTGTAAGVAIVYALAVVLLLMIMAMFAEANTTPIQDGARGLHLFALIYLISVMTNDPLLGGAGYWVAGFLVLILAPVVIAFGFSIWAATRPSVPDKP
jgi:uncharacterized membrane protein YhaH (DUF805 family)